MNTYIYINHKTWNEAIKGLSPLELQDTLLDCVVHTYNWLPKNIIIMKANDATAIISLKQGKAVVRALTLVKGSKLA